MIIFLFMHAIAPKSFLSMETCKDQIEEHKNEKKEQKTTIEDEIKDAIEIAKLAIEQGNNSRDKHFKRTRFEQCCLQEEKSQDNKSQLIDILIKLGNYILGVYDLNLIPVLDLVVSLLSINKVIKKLEKLKELNEEINSNEKINELLYKLKEKKQEMLIKETKYTCKQLEISKKVSLNFQDCMLVSPFILRLLKNVILDADTSKEQQSLLIEKFICLENKVLKNIDYIQDDTKMQYIKNDIAKSKYSLENNKKINELFKKQIDKLIKNRKEIANKLKYVESEIEFANDLIEKLLNTHQITQTSIDYLSTVVKKLRIQIFKEEIHSCKSNKLIQKFILLETKIFILYNKNVILDKQNLMSLDVICVLNSITSIIRELKKLQHLNYYIKSHIICFKEENSKLLQDQGKEVIEQLKNQIVDRKLMSRALNILKYLTKLILDQDIDEINKHQLIETFIQLENNMVERIDDMDEVTNVKYYLTIELINELEQVKKFNTKTFNTKTFNKEINKLTNKLLKEKKLTQQEPKKRKYKKISDYTIKQMKKRARV